MAGIGIAISPVEGKSISMFKSVFRELEKEVSGEIALKFVSEISRHHRIQASSGMRVAVRYAVETLKGFSLDARVHEYHADRGTYYWSGLQFREWAHKKAGEGGLGRSPPQAFQGALLHEALDQEALTGGPGKALEVRSGA